MGFSTAIKIALEGMLQQNAPLYMLTDSKPLFDAITKRSQISEKRLLIDLATLRDACRRSEMDSIGFIRTQYNIADPLAKSMGKPILDDCNV